jgi:chromosome segregation ATPase
MISKHVIKYIQFTVDDMVAESVRTQTEPLIKQIEDSHHTIKCQSDQIAKQSVEIQTLQDKINEVENRIEKHEQYSRRASLRFNNVSAPVDNKGQIIILINTDQLVLDICNKNLKQSISIEDIGRSHPIGETKNGKTYLEFPGF